MQIIILGMHRSGTSAVTRLVNMMGAYFGPEGSSTGANEENPKGFWERRDVRNLNDALLSSANADWDRLAEFHIDAIPDAARAEFTDQAKRLLLDFDAHRPWLLKEPRLCILLPIWLELLEAPIIVHCLRRPMEIALSLKKRNGFPLHAGLALWERYTVDALRFSAGIPSVPVRHDRLICDPVATTTELFNGLQALGTTGLRMPAEREIRAFIDPSLYRARSDADTQDQFLPPPQAELQRRLEHDFLCLLGDAASLTSSFDSQRGLEELEELARMQGLLKTARAAEATAKRQLADSRRDLAIVRAEANRAQHKSARDQERLTKQRDEVKQWLLNEKQTLSRLRTQVRKRAAKGKSLVDATLHSSRWKVGNTLVGTMTGAMIRKPAFALDSLRLVLEDLDTLARNAKRSENMVKASPIQDSVCPTHSLLRQVDVVVCVHNALSDVRRCLHSITHNTPRLGRLIIIDDGSEPETADYVRAFASEHGRCTLLRNASAVGYTKAANQGMSASKAEHVVLLNSDTIVSRGWMERMGRCFTANTSTGIVGPLSNAASWQSVPERFASDGDWAVNLLPSGVSVRTMAKLIASVSKLRRPRVPVVNGFCFMVSRRVIDAIGLFDEATFPLGYGEENDYCIRAAKAGFQLTIADDAYVYHAKSMSFSHERRRELARIGCAALDEKYGSDAIQQLSKQLKESSALEEVRQAVSQNLAGLASPDRPISLLYLLPTRPGGGGVHSVVQESCGLRALGLDVQIVVPSARLEQFLDAYPSVQSDIFTSYESAEDLSLLSAERDAVVATVFTSVRLLAEIVNEHPHLLPVYYVQDYEPWICKPGSPQVAEAAASYDAIPGMLRFAKTDWICDMVIERHQVPVHKVTASLDHAVYFPPTSPDAEAAERSVCVSAMVRPRTPRRSAAMTMRVLAQLKQRYGDAVEIVTFGCSSDEAADLPAASTFEYDHRGILRREGVADVLRRSDIFIDLSTYQAFGRTALEAMACRTAVLVPSRGGTSEYAKDRVNARVVDTQSEQEVLTACAELIEDRSQIRNLSANAVSTASGYTVEAASRSVAALIQSALSIADVIPGDNAENNS